MIKTASMRLSTGEIIYTDPLNWDTDGDGIRDGDEIVMGGFGSIHAVRNEDGSYTFTSDYGITFYMKSNPTMSDTDGDGISDKDDTAPFEIGIGNGVIGEMTIVSCAKDGVEFYNGHSFLLYKSFINDTIDFSEFYSGYEARYYNGVFLVESETPCLYNVNRNNYITLCAAARDPDEEGKIFSYSLSSLTKKVDGGVWYNWDIMVAKYSGIYKYYPNSAITYPITKSQLNTIIDYYNCNNYYNLFTNNCTKVAAEAWNLAFNDNLGTKGYYHYAYFHTPQVLKSSISSRKESFQIDMLPIIEEFS